LESDVYNHVLQGYAQGIPEDWIVKHSDVVLEPGKFRSSENVVLSETKENSSSTRNQDED
jgi:hypothetical protein